MTTHSSVLAGKIPWTEEPVGLQSLGLQRVRHDWALMVPRLFNWERSVISTNGSGKTGNPHAKNGESAHF